MDAQTLSTTSVGDLLSRITRDVKTIAHDELELVRDELRQTTKTAAADAAIVLLGALVALIGFGLLCLSAVVALQPIIASLAVRLLLMAIVYVAIGGVLGGSFAVRLKRDIVPDLSVPAHEAKRTVEGVKYELKSEERPIHA
jgi:uncharacterized membrane protein YqjE